ncbi:dethiobiotin synthase [bacterium]|nr:dethiobiotin synthase [bacterium]
MILFVSGTGTAVGKTWVACALVRHLLPQGVCGVCKPVATGAVRRGGRSISGDAIRLMRAAGLPMSEIGRVNPVLFSPPLSPHLAARMDRRPIDLGRLRRHIYNIECGTPFLVVEGVGGVATPLTSRSTWGDFMAGFRSPRTLLVCSPRLGTLNHTLLSLEYLASRKVACPLLVVSNYDPSIPIHRQNVRELRRLTKIPVSACRRGAGILSISKFILS